MARRRGINDSERLALDMATITATAAIVAAPCFVYSLDWTVSDESVSAKFSFGDTTAVADLVLESTRLDLKYGMALASGLADNHNSIPFNPPVYCGNGAYWANSTGIASVSISYLAAS